MTRIATAILLASALMTGTAAMAEAAKPAATSQTPNSSAASVSVSRTKTADKVHKQMMDYLRG